MASVVYSWVAVHEAIGKADGVVFRCSLSGSDAGRWLEVPAWMSDRSAFARARIATDAYADLAALTTLATLLRHTLNDHFASSNAPVSGASKLSRNQNRGEVYATPDKADSGAPPRAATNRPVRRRTADDDRWHAGMVRAADGDPSSADHWRLVWESAIPIFGKGRTQIGYVILVRVL